MHLFRSSLKLCLAVSLSSLGPLGLAPARGAEQVVLLKGVSMTLQDVTSETAVYYTSMRLNRALNIWNVEATVSNKSVQTFTGPLVLVVDSAPGTSGLLQPDGVAGVSAAVDLSRKLTQNALAPGRLSAPQTLSFGVSTGTPSLATRVFALPAPATNVAVGFVRTLDEAGQPLGPVAVEETGPAGRQTNQTDAAYGAATLGEGPVRYTWEFSAPGFLPVWRRQTLDTNGVAQIPYPRLTGRSTNAVAVSPVESVVISNATVAIAFASGSVNSNQTATLTPLTAQTLPALLPPGWSPLQAFWLEMQGRMAVPPSATLQLWGPMNQGETGALVVWNSQAFQWDVLQLVTSLGGNVISTTLPGAGAYAFVVGDSAPATPPAPQVNQALAPSTAPSPDTTALSLSGQVAPSSSPASLDPALVTGTAAIAVALTNGAGGLASGLLLECDVQEQYQLIRGTAPVTPAYANFIVAYQRPGTNATNTLQASFPIRPLRLFGPAQLNQASVSVGVLTPGPFGGVLLTTNGGQMVSGDVQLLAGASDVASPQALLVTSLNPTNFANLATNLVFLRAFDLIVTGLLPGSSLASQLGNGPTNAVLVMARVLSGQSATGLEPVARLASDGQGRITSLETNATDNLPGISGSGLYVLVQVTQPQALVKGVALNSQGQPAGGLIAGLGPWTTLSRAPDGQFLLVAPAGDNQLSVSNLATGDTGQSDLPITAGQTEVTPTLGTALAGLQVVSTSPTNNAANVPQVTSITVDFSRALNPAMLTTNTVQLLEGGQPVPVSLSLDAANTTATILPDTQLDSATNFTLVLATNITDTTGRPLQGQTQFTFATVPLSTRGPAAQLIIYQPGATNLDTNVVANLPGFVPGTNASLIVVQGTPGTADPGVPVIVANEGSGQTTTVLSKSDGSFTTFVSGQEQDIISATFVSLNGARLYVPVTRQLFDDGSVGLYPQGGVLQAAGDGGPVQLTVPPNALPSRAKFKLNSVTAPELQAQLGGIMPSNGVVAGSALNLSIQGAAPALPLQVSFPVDLTALGYPTNEVPTNAAAALTVVTTNQNVTAFQEVAQAFFQPNPASQLRPGPQAGPRPKGEPRPVGGPRPLGGGNQEQNTVGAMNAILQFSGVGFGAQFLFNTFVTPLLFGPLPVTIKGFVGAVPADLMTNINAGQTLSGAQALLGAALSFTGPLGAQVGQVFLGASGVADWQLTAAQLNAALPLSGAFVTCALSGGPLVVQRGRLNPGMVYATSGADGYFLLVAPQAGAQYLVTATHPMYGRILDQPVNPVSFNPFTPSQLSLAGVVFKNFIFSMPVGILTPPNVTISTVPIQPAAGQPCTVQVSAYQPTAPPAITVTVASIGTQNLLTDHGVANATASITGATTNANGNTVIWTGTLTASDPVRVTLGINVQGQNSAQDVSTPYSIDFRGKVPLVPTTIPPPAKSDVHGPVVVAVDPPDNGFIGENSAITVTFNKPIDAAVTNELGGISLAGPGAAFLAPILALSADQTVLQLQFPGLQGGWTYTLTLSGQSIRDLAGQPLNQVPSGTTPVSFMTTFRTATTSTAPLTDLDNGRGVVISGTHLYALDQGPEGNWLEAYDISTPLQPQLESEFHLEGAPRDLVVIPQFRYVTNNAGAPVQTNDLVVVVGGDLDAQLSSFGGAQGPNVFASGQYLWVVNMGDPKSPQLLADPIVTYDVSAAVSKVRWAPPYLVYQQYGADIQLLGFVNLQEMLIGFGSTLAQINQFPPNGQAGSTTNSDGTYVDPGETLPLPPQLPPEFFGKHQSYVVGGTTQPILDFSVVNGGEDVGITLRNGVLLDPKTGNPTVTSLPPCYRTLVSSGQPLNIDLPTDAAFPFGATAYPRWVSLFGSFGMLVNGAPLVRPVALVSLAPDTDNVQKLVVIDISLPETPRLVNAIPIPTSLLGGSMQSVSMRSDGLLELAGSQSLVVLNPAQMAITNVPAGQLPPCIVDVVSGAGSIQRSLGSSDFGVHAVADGGRGVVVQSPPLLKFVSFPLSTGLVDPTALARGGDASLMQLFASVQTAGALSPARVRDQPSLNITSDLAPKPNPALHYYVLMVAPGGAGPAIDLGLEAVNLAGWPISNLGSGFAPVRAVSFSTQTAIGQTPRPGCGAPIRALTAYRLSNDPNSAFFNYYLSRPFVLITEAVSSADVLSFQSNVGIDREILFGGFSLRAFIEPGQSANLVLGPFAARIDNDRQLLYPVSVVSAPTVDRSYIPGDNPPPPGSAAKLPGTYGSICAHSSELRTDATDLVLPSPRMPLEIRREIGDQDSYEGPFGVGWDFNYNQRLTVLNPETFPQGLQLPVVTRDNATDSVVAGSKDVLFNNGMGQTILFQWVSDSMPPEYAQDPVVKQFDYQDLVADYYLPAVGQGVFDLFVHLKDGRFERLTPGGELYRYTAQGRLESRYDRFPANYHWLQYDSHGWLTRIDDDSVAGARYVLFGYYRHQNSAGQMTDPDFTAGLDIATANPVLEGKICRLADYAGRDILYQYTDDGFLTNRLGTQVNGENGGYAGRSHTFYNWSGCRLVEVAATVNGTPILSVSSATSNDGKPVAQSTTGIGGPVKITAPLQNTAASLANQVTAAGLADGSTTQFTLDKWGNPTATTVSGPSGPPATTITSNTAEGLLFYVKYPEGNTKTMTYDTGNPVFRSRANVLQTAMDPGPRGGTAYTETFLYDPRYNLQSGAQKDGNGFITTYQLSADGRAVNSIVHGSAGTDTFAYNSNGQLTSSTDLRGIAATMVYDPTTGFVTSRTLGDNTYTYTYGSDVASQLGRPASIILPVGAPIQMAYNANLQPLQIQRDVLVEQFGYDELGYAVFHQQQLGDGTVLVLHNVYDAKGFLWTNTIDGVEVNGQVTSLEYDYTPDPVSRVQQIRFPQGTVQEFQYDSRGNATNITLGDFVESYALDMNNNVTAVTQGGDLVQTTVYDGFDRPVTVIRKTGAQDETVTSSFYPEGELNSRAVTDPQFGVLQQHTYDQIDELGRPLHLSVAGTTISPAFTYTYAPGSNTMTGPRMTTQQTWNAAGYDTGLTDPILTTTLYPDGNGRVTRINRQEDGATYNELFTYDNLDHRTSTADDLGTLFLYLSRADGAVLGATNALGHVTTYEQSALAELLDVRRQDGMEFKHQHDPMRRPSYNGDPAAGFHYAYDGDLRMTNSTLRNGAATVYGNFDPRNLPQTLNLPGGGTATMLYDLQRRMTDKTVSYLSTAYETHATYDAMDRAQVVTYQQDGGAVNAATNTYDEAGPLLSERVQEDVGDFTVQYGYYADGTRNSITYPSGVTVTEQRDTSGRLTGVSDAHGNIISASSWQGNVQPKVVQLGATMQVVNTYDVRGRVTGRRVTRLGDGAVLVHLRYQYDGANNQQIRQFLHRNGKADNLFYDSGERLSEARVGTVPLLPTGFTPPLYDRTYNYEPSGLDYLASTVTTNLTPDIPSFATNWTSHDAFLLPAVVDGFNRGQADPMGNVVQAMLQTRPAGGTGTVPVSATLTNNGNGSLISITRADGLAQQNFFQPNGLRYERRVSQGSQVLDFRHFVYDDKGRLLEEYEQTNGAPTLIGRYYYATADAPEAADLMDPATGRLTRYYFLKDNMQSVVAVADTNGVVVERTWYDPFGQPAIQQQDTSRPIIRKVLGGDAGSLWVVFSESVWPTTADPGPGGGIVALSDQIASVLTVTLTPTNGPAQAVQGTNQWVPALAGFPPYSVVRFSTTSATQTLSGPIGISLSAGALQDEWGNTNRSQTVAIQATGTVGTVYYAVKPDTQTEPAPLARSSVGSPFLFHGQYFDYDAGLVYLRARFYDPYSGMFLEPDALGYADSVNLYAGMGNDPVGVRDPSGLAGWVEVGGRIIKTFTVVGARAAAEAPAIEAEGRAAVKLAEDVGKAAKPTLTSRPLGLIARNLGRYGRVSGYAITMEGANAAKAEKAAKAFLEMQKSEMFIAEMKRLAEQAARTDRLRAIEHENNRVVSLMATHGISESAARARLAQRIVSVGAEDESHINKAMGIAPRQGYFDVFMHGEAHRVAFGNTFLSAEGLAELIKAHPGWNAGLKIRLVSCNTGSVGSTFAQRLATAMNTHVWAPNGFAFASNGGVLVGFKVAENDFHYIGGRMLLFKP